MSEQRRYHEGGVIPPGLTCEMNTGRREIVLTQTQLLCLLASYRGRRNNP